MKHPVPSGTFEWRGEQLPYFDDPAGYNTPIRNERAVEVPIARRWLEDVAVDSFRTGLEVGNVLGHYQSTPVRTIVDLYETGPDVNNVDLFDITIPASFDWVLAISTVEHVQWDFPPRHPLGAIDAVEHLRSLLKPGGRMLITVPFGSNPGLDAAILLGYLEPDESSTMLREDDGTWTEQGGAQWREYGTVTIWANAVWIATWSAP